MVFPCKTQDAAADVENVGVGDGTPGLDQFHCLLGCVPQRNQDGGSHGHAAVTALGAVRVDFPARFDGLQSGAHAAPQAAEGDDQQWVVHSRQP